MKKILIVLVVVLAVSILIGLILSKDFSVIPVDEKRLDPTPSFQKNNTIQILRNIPSKNDNFSFGSQTGDDALSILNDILEIKVGYSGGCKDHEFILVSKGGFLESNPVQVETYLVHNDKGDGCEMLISRTLKFDLTPLRDSYIKSYRSNKGTMIIHVYGSGDKKESIRYEF